MALFGVGECYCAMNGWFGVNDCFYLSQDLPNRGIASGRELKGRLNHLPYFTTRALTLFFKMRKKQGLGVASFLSD